MNKVLYVIFWILVALSYAEASKAEVTFGQGQVIGVVATTPEVSPGLGLQFYQFGFFVPGANYQAQISYLGMYKNINKHLTIGAMGGLSMNLPAEKTLPVVALNAWGEILPRWSYYAEVNMMGAVENWFYTAQTSYQLSDKLSLGLDFTGFGEGRQELRIAPTVSYLFSDRIKVIGAAYYTSNQQIVPSVKVITLF